MFFDDDEKVQQKSLDDLIPVNNNADSSIITPEMASQIHGWNMALAPIIGEDPLSVYEKGELELSENGNMSYTTDNINNTLNQTLKEQDKKLVDDHITDLIHNYGARDDIINHAKNLYLGLDSKKRSPNIVITENNAKSYNPDSKLTKDLADSNVVSPLLIKDMEYSQSIMALQDAMKKDNEEHPFLTKISELVNNVVPLAGNVVNNSLNFRLNKGEKDLSNILFSGGALKDVQKAYLTATPEEKASLVDYLMNNKDVGNMFGAGFSYNTDIIDKVLSGSVTDSEATMSSVQSVFDAISIFFGAKAKINKFYRRTPKIVSNVEKAVETEVVNNNVKTDLQETPEYKVYKTKGKQRGLGKGKGRTVRVVKSNVERQIERATDNIVTGHNEGTLLEAVYKGNPEKGSELAKVAEGNDQLAQGVAGTSSSELANNHFNVKRFGDNIIVPYVDDLSKLEKELNEVKDALVNDGGASLTDTEINAQVSNIASKFESVEKGNLKVYADPTLTHVGVDESGVSGYAHFRLKDRGVTVDDISNVAEQIKYNFKELGATDRDLMVEIKDGKHLIEVPYHPDPASQAMLIEKVKNQILTGKHPLYDKIGNPETFGKDLYLRYRYSNNGLSLFSSIPKENMKLHHQKVEEWLSKSGLFDSSKKGWSITNHALSLANIIEERFLAGFSHGDAVVAKALGKMDAIYKDLEKLTKKTDTYKELVNIIEEGNRDRKEFTRGELFNRGLDEASVDYYNRFRMIQDTLYELSNRQLVNSLRAKGVQVFETKGKQGSFLSVREMRQGYLSQLQNEKFYDPETGTALKHVDVMNKLKNGKGKVYILHDSVTVGKNTELHYMYSPEDQVKGYVRSLSDTDKVLNKHAGYYQAQYKAKYFIYKNKMENGKPVMVGGEIQHEVVGAARSMHDAKTLQSRLFKNTGEEHFIRGDKKIENNVEDMNSYIHNNGGTSFRARGKPLKSVVGDTYLDSTETNIMRSPVESLIHSTNAVISRSGKQIPIDIMKERLMDQFHEHMPRDKYGRIRYPENASEIKHNAGLDKARETAHARELFEVIRAQEIGFEMWIDKLYAKSLNALGSIAGGNKYMSPLEGAMYDMAKRSPTKMLTAMTFINKIVFNPIRQLLMQPVGAFSAIMEKHSAYTFSGKFARDWVAVSLYKLGGNTVKPFLKMLGWTEDRIRVWDEFSQQSDYLSDIQSFNSGTELHHISSFKFTGGMLKPIKAGLSKVVSTTRKLGFDQSNKMATVITALANFDEYWSKGWRGGSKREHIKLQNKINIDLGGTGQSFSFNYQKNSLKALTLFEGFTHKMFNRVIFDPNISYAMRAKAAGIQAIMLSGVGSWVYGDILDDVSDAIFGDNDDNGNFEKKAEFRATLERPLMAYVFNSLFDMTQPDGYKSNYDYSSIINNEELSSNWRFIKTLIDGEGLYEAFSKTAIGGTFKDMETVINRVSIMTGHWMDDKVLESNPYGVLSSVVKLSSGLNNAMKAMVAYNTGKIFDNKGNVIFENASTTDAVMQAFGIQREEYAKAIELRQEIYKSNDKAKKHIDEQFEYFKSMVTANGGTFEEYCSDSPEKALAMSLFVQSLVGGSQTNASYVKSKWRELSSQPNPFESLITKIILSGTNLEDSRAKVESSVYAFSKVDPNINPEQIMQLFDDNVKNTKEYFKEGGNF